MPGVILYGPPAAGKDTVTKALTRLDNSYRLYRRLKVGPGLCSPGYRMTTLSHITTLRNAGSVVWETRRYHALYIVDRALLTDMLTVCIPVVHVGQVGAVTAVTAALPPVNTVDYCMTVVSSRCRCQTDHRTRHSRHDSPAAGMG